MENLRRDWEDYSFEGIGVKINSRCSTFEATSPEASPVSSMTSGFAQSFKVSSHTVLKAARICGISAQNSRRLCTTQNNGIAHDDSCRRVRLRGEKPKAMDWGAVDHVRDSNTAGMGQDCPIGLRT